MAASDSTVRPRSGDSSTAWSIASTPFGCVAAVAGTASDLGPMSPPGRLPWSDVAAGAAPGSDVAAGAAPCRRDAVEVLDRGVLWQTVQRPPDDAADAPTAEQPDAHAADPTDVIGVDAETRAGP